MLPHICSGDTGRTHSQNSRVLPPQQRHACNVLCQRNHRHSQAPHQCPRQPAPATPFTRFVSQTMDAIQQLANIFAATGAPTPTPTPPPRRTHATTPLPTLQGKTYPHAPQRGPPAVLPRLPPRPPPAPLPRVEPQTINPPHRYSLRSHSRSNHTVEAIG